jgi:hypothetical protein
MSTHEWIALSSFLVLQALLLGMAWENLRGRVKRAEEHVGKLEEALELLAKSSAQTEAVRRDDEKILADLVETRQEMREGFTYFGECLGQLTMMTNTHESWLAAMEQRVAGAAGSRPRMPAVRAAPRPPEWLSPRAHVPPVHVSKADPRREK